MTLPFYLPFYLQDPSPAWYDRIKWRALDLETTNIDKGDPREPQNRVVMSCLDGVVDVDERLADFGRAPVILVAHNAKFELGWLRRYGANISNILPWDTMLAEYVLAGNRGWGLSLDETAQRYGLPGKDPLIDRLIKSGVCPSQIPEHWLRERVKYDAETTCRIALQQYPLLRDAGLLPVFFTRCIVTPVLAAIEANGMRLDEARVVEEYNGQVAIRQTNEILLAEKTGGINMRSRPQLAEFLYDTLKFDELLSRDGTPRRTPSGLRMTDADSMLALKAKTPEQKEFLRLQRTYAHASSRLSKSLEFFMGACQNDAGVILGQFNQAVTQTHRLSASGKRIETQWGLRGAQFQNMPREYKRLFRPMEDGRVLCELDYAQLEFRVAVDLSHDVQGLKDIESGHDVHKFTASVLKDKLMEDVTKVERQAAKPSTFKPLYGGQSGTARERAYYAAFRERYPQIDATQKAWLAEVLRTGELRTASGLIYYWPDTRVQSSGYVTNTPSIFNYPVQAFATADIVLIGLAHLFWQLPDGVNITNTVHDSIILDMPPSYAADVRTVAQKALILDVANYVGKVYNWKVGVPLSGEYVIAEHWGDETEKTSSGTF